MIRLPPSAVRLPDFAARIVVSGELGSWKSLESYLWRELWIAKDRAGPCDNRFMTDDDYAERERRLIARGVLKPPLKRRSSPVSLPDPAGNVSDEVMERLWREEREDR